MIGCRYEDKTSHDSAQILHMKCAQIHEILNFLYPIFVLTNLAHSSASLFFLIFLRGFSFPPLVSRSLRRRSSCSFSSHETNCLETKEKMRNAMALLGDDSPGPGKMRSWNTCFHKLLLSFHFPLLPLILFWFP